MGLMVDPSSMDGGPVMWPSQPEIPTPEVLASAGNTTSDDGSTTRENQVAANAVTVARNSDGSSRRSGIVGRAACCVRRTPPNPWTSARQHPRVTAGPPEWCE